MSIADSLADRIRTHARAAPFKNRLFEATKKGLITPAGFAVYLANVRCLVAHSVIHLARAERVATSRGRFQLADYFARKIAEETGHEKWADQDRLALRASFDVETEFTAFDSIKAVLRANERMIDANPARYLAYILFAEYYIVLAAPAWLRALEKCCGIPTEMVSVIANHIELDQDHVEEALSEIDQLVEPDEASELMESLLGAIALSDVFFAEIAVECERRAAA